MSDWEIFVAQLRVEMIILGVLLVIVLLAVAATIPWWKRWK